MKRIILVLLMFISIASFGQSTFIREGSTSGTNTYTATVTSFTSYTSAALILKFNNGNTSTATINVNSIGAVNIRKWDGDSWEPLASGDIPADSDVLLVHDNTNSYFKAYVLPEIGQGSTYTAGSGLTLTADQFKLGGTITENTTFSNSGFNVTHASSGDRMAAYRIWATTIGLDGSTSAFIQSGDNTVTTSAASGVDIVGDSVRLATDGSQIRLNTDGSLSIDGDVGTSGQVITSNGAGPLTWETPAGGVSDGDKGDITVSSSGTVWNIDAGVVGPTELASLSSSDLAGKLTDEVGTGSAVFSEPDVNVQTGSYTLVLTDKAKEVRMNVAGANNLTVPANSSVAFPVGTMITLTQYGAGTTSVVAGGGVTIRTSAGNLLSPGQYSPMVIRKIATDEWFLWNGATNVSAALTASNAYMTTTIGGTPGAALLAAASVGVKFTGVNSVATGDLVQATGSDTWSVLASVSAGSYLRSAGVSTASVWSTLKLPNSATANRVAYATSSNTIGEDADLTFDGTILTTGQLKINTGATVTGHLSNTATLNFDLTAVNYQDLTITVTGAADGDVVTIGVPNGAVVADVMYFGWVSATNTVSIRCSRVGGGGAADPASGTFRASVTKY